MQSARSGLVVVSPGSLIARGSALAYVRGAVISPPCIAVTVFASCIGAALLGPIGAIAAWLAVVLLIAASTRFELVRRHLDGERQARLRCMREHRRLRLLRPAGPVRLQQYAELRSLVEELERLDPAEAARFELQDLLEHFAVLGNTHQRCLDALRLGGNQLPLSIPIDPKRGKHHREIQLRRMRHARPASRGSIGSPRSSRPSTS